MTDTALDVVAQSPNPEKLSEETQPLMSTVIEALPDIESSHTHPLEQEPVKVEEPCEDSASGSESESERDSKRVKLDDVADAPDGEAVEADEAPKPQEEEITFDLRMTWAGQGYDFRVQGSDRLYDFKVSRSRNDC